MRGSSTSWLRTRLFRDTIIYLGAIHAQRPAVVEDQPVEANNAARRDGLAIEELCVAIRVNDDGIRIRQQRGLPRLRSEIRKQVVRRKRNGISREAAAHGDCANRAIDGLRHERCRSSRSVRGAALDAQRMCAEEYILARDHV